MATLYRYENNINLIKYRHFDGPGILVTNNELFHFQLELAAPIL